MNSSQNKPLNAIFENSGGPIKSDLRAGVHDVYPGADRAAALREQINYPACDDRFRGAQLDYQFVSEAGKIDPGAWEAVGAKVHDVNFASEGLINDPGAKMMTAMEILERFNAMVVSLSEPAKEIALVTAGGYYRGSGKTLSMMFSLALSEGLEIPRGKPDWYVLDECDPDLSPHPGERHRQVERRVHSKRSRAGKAGRWA